MRRLGSILLALLLLAPAALAQEGRLEAQVFEIAAQLRCPVCVSESVAESHSPTALEMREMIQEQLLAGSSRQEILAFFQDRYGDWILLEPPMRGLHLVVWVLPAVAAAAGLLVLILLVRRWTRASRQPLQVDDDDLRRVREALAEGNQ